MQASEGSYKLYLDKPDTEPDELIARIKTPFNEVPDLNSNAFVYVRDLPDISLSLSPASVSEDGTTNIVYTFTRTGPVTDPLKVNYTIGGTATKGIDYANIGTSVTFAKGQSTAKVVIDPTADKIGEGNETISLTLSNSPDYKIKTTSPVTGKILNDDTLPNVSLSVSPASVAEDGGTNIVYTFTRDGFLPEPLTVNYSIRGTATQGTDYNKIGTSVVFAPYSTTAKLLVKTLPDKVVEADETLSLILSASPNYVMKTKTAVTATIIDGDDVLFGTANNNTLSGGSGNDSLYGLGGNDAIKGDGGADLLMGNQGMDTLTGSAGADSFLFNTPGDGVDTITDFNLVEDKILLRGTEFGLSTGVLASSAFTSGAGVKVAGSAAQRLIYNTTNGALYFDADGTGANSSPLQIATLSNRVALTASCFSVI